MLAPCYRPRARSVRCPEALSGDRAEVRHFLTFVAVLLVLTLTAALIAPLFIDWSRHRGQIEAELSAVVGAPVVVAGRIDIRFLPTPYLLLKDVTISGAAGGPPVLVCKSLQLEASLASLPSGRARFTMARLDHPELTLARRPDGSVGLPDWRPQIWGGSVALDRLVVDGGRLTLTGGDAGPLEVAVDLDASAASLSGPFRGSGKIVESDIGATAVDFSSGALADGSLPLKLEASREGGPNLAFDGAVKVSGRDDGLALAYIGSATASGAIPGDESGPATPWRASATLGGDLGAAAAEGLVLRVGPEERALEARGSARMTSGASPRLAVALAAKQLDFDALLRGKDEESAPPARALAALARLAAPLRRSAGSPIAVDAAFTAATAIVGAQTITDVDLHASAAAGAPLTGELALNLPDEASLRLAGAIEFGAAPAFKGTIQAKLGDVAGLRDWATRGEPDWASRLGALNDALPYRAASANGRVEISAVGFSARNLELTLDRSTLTGAVAYTAPVSNDPARLFVDLSSDSLDIDSLPDLKLSAGLLGGADLSLALEAAKLRIGRPGDADFEGGSLSLKLARNDGDLSLEKFSISALGGASVEASAALGAKGRWVKVSIDAAKLDNVAALVGRVAPGAASRWLAARAQALSPVKATLQAWSADSQTPGLDSIKAEGAAGATRFKFAARRTGDVADVSFGLDANDSVALMRQLGLASNGAGAPAHLEGSAKGRWDLGFDANASGALAGADFNWRGRLRPAATGQDASLFGAATLKTADISGLLVALGLAKPGALAAAPVDLAADVTLRGDQLALPRLTGSVAGSKIDGNLAWRPAEAEAVDPDVALAQSIAGEAPDAKGGLAGELSLDRLDLAALVGPLFGVSRATDVAFAPPGLDPPSLDIRVKVGALAFGAGPPARDFSARLRMDRGRVDVDEAAMTIGGARTGGRLTVRRDASLAAATGQVSIEPAAIEQGALRGRVGGEMSFAGSGDSLATLIGGLAGDGKIEWRGVSAPQLDPGALTRELAKTQSGDAPIDETNVVYALGAELDRAPLPLPDGAAQATLSAGVIRVGPLNFPRAGGSGTATAALDLRAQSLALDVVFAETRGGKFWTGSPPMIEVLLKGPLASPTRRVDASALAAGLASQAIARETERISALEADIRERAYFNRRLKAERYMRQREAEVAAYQAEQARVKAEEDRKRADEEAKRAQDEAKRAQEEAKRAQDDATNAPPLSPPLPPPVDAANGAAKSLVGPPAPAPKPKADPGDPTATGLY